jgi:hypothetical protein
MQQGNLFWLGATLLLFYGVGLLMILRPQAVVRWQSRWYRFVWYKCFRVSSAEVPRRWEKIISFGAENPEYFSFSIRVYRILGFVLLATTVAFTLIVIIAVLRIRWIDPVP